jgi:hypothetical protein
MTVLQKSTIYSFIVVIAGCNTSNVENNTSKDDEQSFSVNADYMELQDTKELLKAATPNEGNHFEYKKLIHAYISNLTSLNHELDSINKILNIDSLPTHLRNEFYYEYIIFQNNIGNQESAEKLIREVFVKNPSDFWNDHYIKFHMNLNMSFSKLNRRDCDSATYYYEQLMNSSEIDTIHRYSERSTSTNILLSALKEHCPNSFD